MMVAQSGPVPTQDLEYRRPLARSKADRENLVVAELLHEIATLLADQGASDFRVAAYQHASETIENLTIPVRSIFSADGLPGLTALPTIGNSIAHRIEEFLRSGHIPLLDQLRGDETAERVFTSLPGIGLALSHRIHEQLGIESLPELLGAIDAGKLATVEGLGAKRVRTIRECLLERLRHTVSPPAKLPGDITSPDLTDIGKLRAPTIPVSEILDVDAEYRRLASAGRLPKIAPQKFNPDHSRWLPVLHTHRSDRHYTAMYSNSKRAHELNTFHDWVIVSCDAPTLESRWTVITSQFGRLRGYRIVRGREPECEELYLPSG